MKNVTIFYMTGIEKTFERVTDVEEDGTTLRFIDQYGACVTYILGSAVIGYAINDVSEAE